MNVENIATELKLTVLDLLDMQQDTRTPAEQLAKALPAKQETIRILERRLQTAMEAEALAEHQAAAVEYRKLIDLAAAKDAEADALTAEARNALFTVWGPDLLNAMDGSGRSFAPIVAKEKRGEAIALRGQAANFEGAARELQPVIRTGSYPRPMKRELVANLAPRQFAGASRSIIDAALAGEVRP